MGYAFSDGVWQIQGSLTSLCAVGMLRLDYRNVVSLGFALQELRPVPLCYLLRAGDTQAPVSSGGNSALCLQRPLYPDP